MYSQFKSDFINNMNNMHILGTDPKPNKVMPNDENISLTLDEDTPEGLFSTLYIICLFKLL